MQCSMTATASCVWHRARRAPSTVTPQMCRLPRGLQELPNPRQRTLHSLAKFLTFTHHHVQCLPLSAKMRYLLCTCRCCTSVQGFIGGVRPVPSVTDASCPAQPSTASTEYSIPLATMCAVVRAGLPVRLFRAAGHARPGPLPRADDVR